MTRLDRHHELHLVEQILELVRRDCRRHALTEVEEVRQLGQADAAIEGFRERGQPLALLVATLRLETRTSPYGVLAAPAEWSRLLEDFEAIWPPGVRVG